MVAICGDIYCAVRCAIRCASTCAICCAVSCAVCRTILYAIQSVICYAVSLDAERLQSAICLWQFRGTLLHLIRSFALGAFLTIRHSVEANLTRTVQVSWTTLSKSWVEIAAG